MYWYLDHTGSSNIDHAIPSGIISYVLWFSSQFIPVYKLTTVALAVRAVINAGVPVAVILPKSDIPQHMTNGDYRRYYNDRIRTITPTTKKQEEELFFRPNRWVPGLATGPCLFPYPPQGQVSDFSDVSVTGYLFGQRGTSTLRHQSSAPQCILLEFKGAAPMEHQAFPQADDNGRICTVCLRVRQQLQIPTHHSVCLGPRQQLPTHHCNVGAAPSK